MDWQGKVAPWVRTGETARIGYALGEALAVYLVHYLVFFLLYSKGGLPAGLDGYYHFTVASQLSAAQLAVSIDSLPFTALGPSGTDAHWLIHWLQKPLTMLDGDPASVIREATLVWSALVPALLTLLLRLSGVHMAPLFAVLGCWSLYSLPERFLMFRAQNFAVVLLALLAVLAGKRRLLAFGVAIFLFNHSYQGVILAALVVGAAITAEAVVWRRLNGRLITVAAVGLFLSIITSPWFPGNLHYFVTVTLGRLLFPVQDPGLMGVEWFSLEAGAALKAGIIAHLCVAFSLVALVRGRSRILNIQEAVLPILFCLLASGFLVLYIRHWRMGEFYGPFAAMGLAFAFTWFFPEPTVRLRGAVIAVCLLGSGFHQYSLSPAPNYRGDQLVQQCSFLQQFARPADMVFNTSWGQYTTLIWCAPELKYISGLDGTLLAQGDVEMFNQWYLLNKGAIEKLDPVELNRQLARSSARFILVKPDSPGVVEYILEHVPGAQVAVANGDGVLLVMPGMAPGP
jgi:hypothetical protein